MNATQPGGSLSKGQLRASLRGRLLAGAFGLLYGRLGFFHEIAGRALFGRAWSARRTLVIPVSPGGTLVDIGCGDGRLLMHSRLRRVSRVGVEPSRAAAARARRRGAPVVVAAAQALPVRAGTVSHIVSTYPGPWVFDVATWSEIARALAPGGDLAILIGGDYRRGRLAGVRALARRLAYGSPPAEDAPDLPLPRQNELRGRLECVEDEWGIAWVWRGCR